MKGHGIALAAVAALLVTGCQSAVDHRQRLMDDCFDKGGTYFEYENTSAGSHVWCVGPNGERIAVGVKEGDR